METGTQSRFIVVGQNLFSHQHREFIADTLSTMPAMVPRGVYAGAQLRF